ncbi:hypothetical protein BV20DRAFT_976101 [Pilatotrama ljubarskyi]|nr:hypothetical protein BV20DRAFT_976101 [Pilatotrama ljubarskyi]
MQWCFCVRVRLVFRLGSAMPISGSRRQVASSLHLSGVYTYWVRQRQTMTSRAGLCVRVSERRYGKKEGERTLVETTANTPARWMA